MVSIEFEKKVKGTIEKLNQIEVDISDDDTIQFIEKIADWVYNNELDNVPPHLLARYGGKLQKCYQRATMLAQRARAERETHQHHYDVQLNELIVGKYAETEKVTYAKAEARKDLAPIMETITELDYKRKRLQTYADVAKMTASFMQSVMSDKRSERYQENLNQEA
jgi:predicted ribosome quality control (RQC) complex YloA/Tae2 family protein